MHKDEEKMNKFTLIFSSVELEKEYRTACLAWEYSSRSVNVMFCVIMAVYFIIKIIIVTFYEKHYFPSYTFAYELFQLALFLVVITWEIVINYFNVFFLIQGTILYFLLLTLSFLTAFLINDDAVIGIFSISVLLIIPAIGSLYFKSWVFVGIINCISSITVIIFYIIIFHSVHSLGQLVLSVICLTIGLNHMSVPAYVRELNVRKAFLLSCKEKQRKERWKEILDSLPIGIAIIKNQSKIFYINKTIHDLSAAFFQTARDPQNISVDTELNNFQEEGNYSKVIDFFSAVKDRARTEVNLAQIAFAEDHDAMLHMQFVDKSLEIEIKKLHISSLHEKIVVLKDMTTYEKLIKDKLVGQYQKMLFSSVSHEIRNPLHSAQGFLSLISEERNIETLKQHAKNIELQIMRMRFLLSGASELMLNEADTVYIEPNSFSLRDCIQEMLQLFNFDILSKHLQIRLIFTDTVPELFFSVQEKFKIIMFHLLSNAIKYTEKGEIRLILDYDREDKKLLVKISDTGCGISKESLEKLFQLYSHIDSANPYNPQGMGLGLTLCKHLCTILGGEIGASSIVGKGTEFNFAIKNFNLYEGQQLQVKTEGIHGKTTAEVKILIPSLNSKKEIENTTEKECECNRVLIVDDEPCNRMVLKAYLQIMKIGADEASNGREALQMIETKSELTCCQKYDLILMDINMPVMDGTEATAEMIERFKLNPSISAPIIAITAASLQSRKDIQNLLSVGFKKILQKPVSKKQFEVEVGPFLFTSQHFNEL